MSDYKTTIGLEIHAELATITKMFCACHNDIDEEVKSPNIYICPVCMGHPGTLPTINKKAVESVLRVGVALGSKLADFTEFDRKNYFYPDIPKGYQISQYKYPLVTGGNLNGVEITRIHLEEDTATSKHFGDYSLVDYNRAGVPLMELVTEPVITDAKQASDFAKELQLLMRTLQVSNAEMSKGEMRVEANISVSKTDTFGTKVEVKNLNSFRSVERAIEYEVERHIELLEKGEKIIQETRGWDEDKQKTFSQREKENSHDYRYFPDPDLPKLKLSEIPEFSFDLLKAGLPELPSEKRLSLKANYDLNEKEIEVLVEHEALFLYFAEVTGFLKNKKGLVRLASNYLFSDLISLVTDLKNINKIPAEHFGALIMMLKDGAISSRAGKDILKIMFEQGGAPESIAQERGLLQKSDEGEIEVVLKKIIEENPSVVADFKAGKASALMFFVGRAIKESKGSFNPAITRSVAEKLLQ